ncbi:hypothetical protein ACOJ2L_19765, partial [Bacillus pumilus]
PSPFPTGITENTLPEGSHGDGSADVCSSDLAGTGATGATGAAGAIGATGQIGRASCKEEVFTTRCRSP